MPRYKKKITRPMSYAEFKEGIQDLDEQKKAFLAVLFFSGCRVSEALFIRDIDITCTYDFIYVDLKRLKGSKQTDPIGLPNNEELAFLCGGQRGRLFPWCRKTGYNIVKRSFGLYPHYFRMNRITKISEKHGDAYVYSFTGICAQSIDHYRAKVDIKKVSKALIEEVKGY